MSTTYCSDCEPTCKGHSSHDLLLPQEVYDAVPDEFKQPIDIDAYVEKVAAELPGEVWTAVRITSTGSVAFMGTFTSRDDAIAACEANFKTQQDFNWQDNGVLGRMDSNWLNAQFTTRNGDDAKKEKIRMRYVVDPQVVDETREERGERVQAALRAREDAPHGA